MHLTNKEKIKELEYLETRIADGPHPDGQGGRGYIDLSIVPYLRRINRLNGVCTKQSCAGHILISAADGKEYTQPGNLWLRLSGGMAVQFRHCISDFVKSPLIERVSFLYLWHDDRQEVQEVVSVDFQGEGGNHFEDSMEKIVGFLIKLEQFGRHR